MKSQRQRLELTSARFNMNAAEEFYRYLSYVTLREAWSVVKGHFVAWLIVCAICFGSGLFASSTESFWRSVPKEVWFLGILGAILWYFRGEEVKFRFPALTFRLWGVIIIALGLCMFAANRAPAWAGTPIYMGFAVLAEALDKLAILGRENYLKLADADGKSADFLLQEASAEMTVLNPAQETYKVYKYRFRCESCDWTGLDAHVLSAPHPFKQGESIKGCPQCKEISQIFQICDSQGCEEIACMRLAVTKEGIRFFCHKHMQPEW